VKQGAILTMSHKSISNLDQAKHDIVHKGNFSASELSELTNIPYGTLCNKVHIKSPNHFLMVDEAINIQKIQQVRNLIEAECQELGGVFIQVPDDIKKTSDVDLIEAWALWHKDTAETGTAISEALKCKSITKEHLKKIHKEIFEDFQRELELFHRMEALCDE